MPSRKDTDKPAVQPLTTMPETSHGFEAFHACNDSMNSWEYHSHDFYELYIHVGGAQFFCLDNDRYSLAPDVFILVPPFSMHGLAATGVMREYDRGYLNLSSDLLRQLGCGQVDLDAFFRSYFSRGQHMFQLTREETARCTGLLDRLQALSGARSGIERFQACSMIISFLSVICDVLSRTPPISADAVPGSVMQEVLTYINRNYTQDISMKDLARRFGISVSYLSHEFVRYTRRSVYDYVLYRRIMLAREMIITPMSLNTIAFQCGFNDYSNFLRCFHKVVGMSPRVYREMRKSQNGMH